MAVLYFKEVDVPEPHPPLLKSTVPVNCPGLTTVNFHYSVLSQDRFLLSELEYVAYKCQINTFTG